MRLSHVVRSLVSGSVLYIAMAACGSSDHSSSATRADGGPDTIGDGAASDGILADGSEVIDAFVDELENPVKDANAGPLPPDVATEQCNKAGTYAGAPYLFATHAYPGKSAQDLTAVRALSNLTATAPVVVGGVSYEHGTPAPFIHDGSVTVLCGASGSLSFDAVTFILPQ